MKFIDEFIDLAFILIIMITPLFLIYGEKPLPKFVFQVFILLALSRIIIEFKQDKFK